MIWIPGPAGRLEGLLDRPATDCETHAAFFCHPHSQYGGTMLNKVVYTAARAARDLGLPAVRFNFRGVGRSAGRFGGGAGEIEDARAVLAFLEAEYPGRAFVAGGVSFGSWVAGIAAGADPRVAALVSIATPIALYGAEYLSGITVPTLFVQASEDEFGPVEQLREVMRSCPGSSRLATIEGASHLFPGRLHEVAAAVEEFLRDVVAGSAPASRRAGSQE